MNKEQIQQKAKTLVSELSNKSLEDAYADILSREKNQDNNSVRIWLIDEIESRFEAVGESIRERYKSEVNDALPYDELLLKLLQEKNNT
tara:strand:- start:553 stop:819 length:267 start_codon:yes stop_codon:yes gene_type:complete